MQKHTHTHTHKHTHTHTHTHKLFVHETRRTRASRPVSLMSQRVPQGCALRVFCREPGQGYINDRQTSSGQKNQCGRIGTCVILCRLYPTLVWHPILDAKYRDPPPSAHLLIPEKMRHRRQGIDDALDRAVAHLQLTFFEEQRRALGCRCRLPQS